MARPSKNNAEYFPHYSQLRNHRKVKVLRNKFGSVIGYAFWCMMLEWLTEHDGLEWQYDEMELEMFSAELGVSVTETKQMVDFCFKLELLSKTDSGFVFSDSLNENLQPVFDKRRRSKELSKTRKKYEKTNDLLVSVTETLVSATESTHAVTETPQSKVEKSKEKNIYNSDFSEKSKKSPFKPPKIEEVISHLEDNFNFNKTSASEFAELFHSFYESNGWMAGKNKMKDWKSAVRGTWKDTREKVFNKYQSKEISQPTQRNSLNDKYRSRIPDGKLEAAG